MATPAFNNSNTVDETASGNNSDIGLLKEPSENFSNTFKNRLSMLLMPQAAETMNSRKSNGNLF